jgi:hypothetical protein
VALEGTLANGARTSAAAMVVASLMLMTVELVAVEQLPRMLTRSMAELLPVPEFPPIAWT